MIKNETISRNIAIFHFLDFFALLEAKMMKHDKTMKKT
jgi:hypothetical protein